MGMFSTIINHCPDLGDDFMGQLQTKDLENMLDYYWLAPDGCLFMIDTGPCFSLEENPDSTKWYDRFQWQPTGLNGRLKPYRRSFVARMYPSRDIQDWKEVNAFFKMGKLNAILPMETEFFGGY
jgi:hypothetical protein